MRVIKGDIRSLENGSNALRIYKLKSVQYRLGKRTIMTETGYHVAGTTPLMGAVYTGQHLDHFWQQF